MVNILKFVVQITKISRIPAFSARTTPNLIIFLLSGEPANEALIQSFLIPFALILLK